MQSTAPRHLEHDNAASQHVVPRERRSFVAVGLSAAAGLVLSACESVVGVPTRSKRTGASRDEVRALLAQSTLQAEERRTVLMPSYLPRGYVYSSALLGRGGGFRGGLDELTVVFQNPAGGHHPRPILVDLTPRPARRFLIGQFDCTPSQVMLGMTDGVAVDASYYEGTWEVSRTGQFRHRETGAPLRWSTTGSHSLVFTWGGYQIGVSGYRRGGVSLDELIRIASSLYPQALA